jgi:hypothetical protein
MREINMSKEFTHAYCDLCEKIQKLSREELLGEDTMRSQDTGQSIPTLKERRILAREG